MLTTTVHRIGAARRLPSFTHPVLRSLSAEATTIDHVGEDSRPRGKFFGPLDIVDGVAVIRLDGPNKMNTINDDMRLEAERMWSEHIANNASIKAAVFISSKKDNFIAGADINMLKTIENKDDLKNMCMTGHDLFDRMKQKGIPVVAAINGACLGGGLEWALKCDYRIASTSKKTKLGLPEVMLGLLPGWGGTQNLPRLVGFQEATTMILTGKEVRPDKAKKIGLVDLVVDPNALETVAIEQAKQLADGSLKPKTKKKNWMRWAMEDTPVGRHLFWQQVDKMVAKNTGGHYPAAYAIRDAIKHGQESGSSPDARRKALEFEADRFVELAKTPVSEALIGLFDGMNAVKKNRFGKPERETKTLGVLGAGLMGAGITQVSCEKGVRVLLKDMDAAAVGRGEKVIGDSFAKKLKRRRMTAYEKNVAEARVVPLPATDDVWKKHYAQADMVIEAVPENLDLKHRVIKEMEEVIPEHCIFASNTSALPIRDIAKASSRPEKIIGMHYFSPVPQMKLLEIICHEGTSKDTAASAVAVGLKQGKLPIVVKDVPGFYVNRCLGPFMVETTALIGAGVGVEHLDKTIKGMGMPVGPITLCDEVGIDVAHHVREFLSGADMGVRMAGAEGPNVLQEMLEKGMLGKKSGAGFFEYDKPGGKKKGINPEVQKRISELVTEDLKLSDEDIRDRLFSRFVNEAVLCLQEGIIERPEDGDIGAVFGCGFFPFTGGPFRMLDQRGIASYSDMMNRFADAYGEQFRPCQLIQDMAKNDQKFYSK